MGLGAAELTGDAYARCQEVAAAARADGYEAIRYPSAAVAREERREGAAPGDTPHVHDNLAVFADALHPGSDVRVVRSEPLPLGE